jgi:hypothetical protein
MSDAPADPLRFDTSGAPASATCSACRHPISHTYYTVGDQVACERCKAELERALQEPPGLAGFVRAIALGSAAGLLGAAVWYAIRVASGYELGIIAIAIGFFVGVAVKRGSGGRGGVAFQLLAVALTYFWIAANYTPDILAAMDADQTAPGEAAERADAAPAEPEPESSPGASRAVKIGVALAMALALPFLMGVENWIGILIIAFGLYQAWSINRRTEIAVAGPFSLASAPAPGASA